MDRELPGYFELPEPVLQFDPYDASKKDAHPLRGLLRYGPFRERNLGAVPETVRIATIAPAGQSRVLDKLFGQLASVQQPRERIPYLPQFPGFESALLRRVGLAAAPARIELPAGLDEQISIELKPQQLLADALQSGLSQLALVRTEWDVAAIYLPNTWERAFRGGPGEDFDLHHFIKATCAAQAMPTQMINDKAVKYFCRASVAWRLSIALYVKAGGVPWKMEPILDGTAFIGLSYAMRTDARTPRYVTCCSQIYDAEGSGLEFLAYGTDASRVMRIDGVNPFLHRDQMRAVMARSLDLYLRRHAGAVPRRVVIHKNSEFKREEIEGCFDALARIDEVELIQVQDTGWRATRILGPRRHGDKGKADNYPLRRGSLLTIGADAALIWTQGSAPSVTGGQAWYQEGKGIPRPLLLRRFAGRSDARTLGREVLALSKMNWNNDQLYDTYPATLGFAHDLAEVVKRMPTLDPRPYPLRLFM